VLFVVLKRPFGMEEIKGPDNPTSQLLPNRSLSGTGKGGKTKEVVEDR
jgi:hypothetical protein